MSIKSARDVKQQINVFLFLLTLRTNNLQDFAAFLISLT